MPKRPARSAWVVLVLVCAWWPLGCGSEAPSGDASASPAPTPAARPGSEPGSPSRSQAPPDASGTPQLKPPAGLDLARSPRIALAEGLTIVNAVVEDLGDYEVVMRVSVPAPERINVSYSATLPVDGKPTELHGGRTVFARDLQSARIYKIRWLSGRSETARGTTALGLSKAVFEEVRNGGSSECSLSSVDQVGSSFGALGLATPEYEATLERVGSGPVPGPVLVDGQRVWIPSVRAKGTFEGLTGDVEAEFWFLDDPDNPLTLRAVIGAARLVVVRIDRGASAEGSRLEKALAADDGVVELSGIYFEFASARLRPESEAAVGEAVSVLRRHPDWRVRFEGHTDSIGSAGANMTLSAARAEAVRQAILDRLGGGAGRLEAAGFGHTRARESNDTPEGRARNRRVEIVRVH